MRITEQQLQDIETRQALKCPIHVRPNHACPICARISHDLTAPLDSIEPEAPPKTVSPIISGKRIRQDQKPLLNKLELSFYAWLLARFNGNETLRAQSKRFKLGNGIWYKPDFTVIENGREHSYEVKGKHAFRGGFENLKVAASIYPEIWWRLVWREDGHWKEQAVLP